jgi:pterin-4a-carbinolamine dehydratase
MADIVPPPPQPPEPQPSQASIIATALNPYANVNLDEARKLRDQYGQELKDTRGALSKAQGSRQSITERNLAAIDESIEGLKNSRYTGAVALNPAVSAAMAAGFLRTTPGVTSNFSNELGNAMGNAAPVIGNLEKSGRDSFALLAELQRKRGEFEAEPLKEEQTQLREREKTEMANLKEAEKALTRAPAGVPTAKDDEKAKLAREAMAQKIIADARNRAAEITKDKMNSDTGVRFNVTDTDKIRKYLIWDQIREHNLSHPPGSIGHIDPAPYKMEKTEEDEARQLADKAVPSDDGKHRDYAEYERSLKPGETKLSKPDWEAQNAAHKAVTVERAKELLNSENALDTTVATVAQLKETAEKLLHHPGLSGVTGNLYGVELNQGTNPDEVAALALIKQIQSIEFLKALPNMKGFGQLTEAEGAKLQASQNALARRMSTGDFRTELQAIVDRANRLEGRLRERLAEKERKSGSGPAPAKPSGGGKGSGPGGAWAIGDRWTDPAGRKLIVGPDGQWKPDE